MRLPRLLAALLFMLVLVSFPAIPAHAATIGVTTTADEINTDGDCSLREAIRAANLNAAVDACPAGDGADTIDLPAGIYTLSIAGFEDVGLQGDFDITDALTITGALSTTTIIDGGALDQVFEIFGGATTISGLTVRNGRFGGIVNQSSGTLAVVDSIISSNSFTGISSSGKAFISGSTIWHNVSNNNGGGILNTGTMLLTNSAVISNTAARGGGIANSRALTVTHSLISDNLAINAVGYGGGIYNAGGLDSIVIVEDSSIVHNRATNHGGGLYNFIEAHIRNTTIADNVAMVVPTSGPGYGGGIENSSNGIMTIADSRLYNNMAGEGGGGILAFGSVMIDKTSIVSNTASLNGGGIFSGDYVTITQSLISENHAVEGGGINHVYSWRSGLLISDSTISRNTASLGGGINNEGLLELTSSAIISNTATNDGGGLYNWHAHATSALTATNSTISGNSAARHGGGIYNIVSPLSLYNTTVAHNVADSDSDSVGDGGGVMRASGTVAFQNSILGANSDQGGQADDCAGALLSQGYNLIQDTSGCTLIGTTDITGQPPLLGPLANNGGPTPTYALLLDSPAIDAGDPAGCRDAQGTLLASDQRGELRPQSGACDIGAFESALAPRSATTTVLTSSGSPTSVGQTIIFTAVVSATVGTPGGSVTFKDGATILGSVALADGLASFNSAALAVGQHSITAEYGGDASYRGSVSLALMQQVVKVGTAVALDASASPSAFGQTVTFTATVQPGASGTLTGTVIFWDGATALGTGTVNNDRQATLSTALLAIGAHSITAEYSGDSSFLGSVSSPLPHQVGKASVTIALTTSAQPSLVGQTVVFTITVGTDGAGTPGGMVTLRDDTTVLGSGALVGGQYTFTTSSLTPGQHSITVEYSGDAQFDASTAPAATHTVLVPVYLPLIVAP